MSKQMNVNTQVMEMFGIPNKVGEALCQEVTISLKGGELPTISVEYVIPATEKTFTDEYEVTTIKGKRGAIPEAIKELHKYEFQGTYGQARQMMDYLKELNISYREYHNHDPLTHEPFRIMTQDLTSFELTGVRSMENYIKETCRR